ncbi:MAG: hypothetical protein Q9M48_02965 [Rhodobacterales bacterium]|nr:hypothetical protein [Rhodobacterales bacterium]
MRYFGKSAALLALITVAACDPTVPDSAAGVESGAGVGFGSYTDYQTNAAAREANLAGIALPAANAVSSETIGGTTAAEAGTSGDIAAETRAALDATSANSGVPPVDASPSNPPPARADSAGISDENDFGSVDSRRTAQDDAALIAANRAQYQQINPTALPSRSGAANGGIVAYALSTSHPVGTKVHRRSGLNAQTRYVRNCGKYPSPDLAQSEFLAKGGPERDRLGLDPDGDGYACSWNPTPFRKAVNG